MGIRREEIIISATVLLSLALIFILGSAKIISNSIGTSIFDALLYFAVCYLYINRISTAKWRILMVALSISLIAVIFSFHFLFKPWTWDFVSRLIYGIAIVALVAFLLMNLAHDQRSTVLFTAFVADVVILFHNREDLEQFNKIFTVIESIIVYTILSAFHVKQIWDQKWKVAAIASAFVAVVVLGILLRFFWYDKEMLFILIASINACVSLVPWLWLMFVPKLKGWWLSYLEHETIHGEQNNFLEIPGLPTRFTIKDLEAATGNFQFQALIGEGASGAVFKGTLADGSTIAVKRIKWQPSGVMEFRTEITIIASLQHVNLVRLLGYCLSSSGDHYLIYPFFENGSLDAWLFRDDTKRSYLTWVVRCNIAIDIAKALAYLHHECHHRILHLDIKPANILLDGNFRALLSDFGMSKLIGRDERSVMTRARGTVGYLAPEMLVPNAISTKSDVYSYGMVLLELLGGRRNFMLAMERDNQQKHSMYYPATVRDRMMQDKLMEVVDDSLVKNEGIREEEVAVLARVGLWCIQENPMLRPSMTEVVEMLEGRKPVDVPPESSMYVMNLLESQPQSSTSTGAQEYDSALMSANNLSISIQSGR
ncbi:Receptor protein kinase [Rhynchospora pubera]|uniref:Receptor protein kinase n=1 Tax=Rhynchospora pubera TaxID=906938 RepID=A0AAV8EBL8_9POAL|nr:Receptor protein kinase [Rhynchospora pubera]